MRYELWHISRKGGAGAGVGVAGLDEVKDGVVCGVRWGVSGGGGAVGGVRVHSIWRRVVVLTV